MSLLKRDVLPFAIGFFALIAVTIGADLLLHRVQLEWVGRYLGIAGALLILVSLVPYSLRKRQMIRASNPAMLLRLHQIGGWLGAFLVTIHAGIHFNAILPWLALALMLFDVASGLAGAFLFHRERLHLEESKAALLDRGLPPAAVERKLFWDALTLDLTKKWRMAHSTIAVAFALFVLAHIVTIFMFWGWR